MNNNSDIHYYWIKKAWSMRRKEMMKIICSPEIIRKIQEHFQNTMGINEYLENYQNPVYEDMEFQYFWDNFTQGPENEATYNKIKASFISYSKFRREFLDSPVRSDN